MIDDEKELVSVLHLRQLFASHSLNGQLAYFSSLKYGDEPLDLDVESFVKGQMYHIDGERLTFFAGPNRSARCLLLENDCLAHAVATAGLLWQGELQLIWPSRYINTCAGFKNQRFLASGSFAYWPNSLSQHFSLFFLLRCWRMQCRYRRGIRWCRGCRRSSRKLCKRSMATQKAGSLLVCVASDCCFCLRFSGL